jgi:hypothetical protein
LGQLVCHLILKILKFKILRKPPIQVLAKNRVMKVLFSEFHRRTNLLALLFRNLIPGIRLQRVIPWESTTAGTKGLKFAKFVCFRDSRLDS